MGSSEFDPEVGGGIVIVTPTQYIELTPHRRQTGNTTGEKVAAIRAAWDELIVPEGDDPLDAYALTAVNVLADWHRRPPSEAGSQP
jgi:hypothetical protein